MSGMLLDSRERLRFLAYAKCQADSSKAIATQMDSIGGIPELLKREQQKAAAWSIVVMELAAMQEEHVVSREDMGNLEADK